MASPTADGDGGPDWVETVESVLTDHPVSVGIVFGSRARRESHENSDVDVAVAFEDARPGDPGHLDERLSLGADLALALGTDDVDVVDVHSAPPALLRSIFRDGELVVGTEEAASRLQETLLADASMEARSPAERFDDALEAIDDHLA
jgi:predicted nucleotidyltransferase